MTDTTPAALERIMERLNTEMVWPQSAMGVDVLAITHPLCREAAAVIAALGVERDAMERRARSAESDWTMAEARLREIAKIAGYCLLDGHTFESLQANLRQIATIARTVGEKNHG